MKDAAVVDLTFEKYIELKDTLLKEFGNSGFLLYSENRAFLCFDSEPDIRFYILGKKVFIRKDFELQNTQLLIIGESKKEFGTFENYLLDDFKNNKFKISIFSFLFFIMLTPLFSNINILMHFNEIMINIMSMFMSMLFVFIGFFYGDKERTVEAYKKGICDREFSTDRYVLILSFLTILLFIVSSLFGNLSSSNIPKIIMNLPNINKLINVQVKFIICDVLSYIAVVLLVICFDSLINYYLKTMRNKYLINAVDDMIKERNNKD